MSSSEDFNWDDVADSVIQQSVEKVAIYTNGQGDIVIRQAAMWCERDDVFILIARGNVEAAIAEMQFAISQAAQAEQPQIAKPEPLSNAERQRLYRQRHQNERSNDTGEPPLRLVNGAERQQELAG